MRNKVFLTVLILLALSAMLVGCSSELYYPYRDEGYSLYFDTSERGEGESLIDFLSRKGYSLTWSDEFDGSTLNLDDWNYELGNGSNGWGNNEIQSYTRDPEEVYLQDGLLHIVANKTGDKWESGRIKTQRRRQFKYGYVEARLKLPKGTGMWPAFWLLGCDQDNENITRWPLTGEFDIMEYAPGSNGNKIFSTLHTNSNNGGNGYGLNNEDYRIDDAYLDEFHTYGLLWTGKFIEVYYDDICVGRKDVSENRDVNTWPFDQYEAFILLNLAIGGWLGGDVPPTATKYEYLIDYVRLYQREGEVMHAF